MSSNQFLSGESTSHSPYISRMLNNLDLEETAKSNTTSPKKEPKKKVMIQELDDSDSDSTPSASDDDDDDDDSPPSITGSSSSSKPSCNNNNTSNKINPNSDLLSKLNNAPSTNLDDDDDGLIRNGKGTGVSRNRYDVKNPNKKSYGRDSDVEVDGSDSDSDADTGPSIGEQMIADQEVVRQEKLVEVKKKKEKDAKEAKKAMSGLKGGFFNSKKKKKKGPPPIAAVKEAKEAKEAKNDIIYELDSNGEMLPSAPLPSSSSSNSSSSHTSVKSNLLNDIKASSTAPSSSPIDAFLNNPLGKKHEYKLLERIQKSPRLSTCINKPRYHQAMEELMKDPKKAMSKYKGDRDVTDFLEEYSATLGDHYAELGEIQDEEKVRNGAKEEDIKERVEGPELGPLAKGAIERERLRRESEKKDGNAVDELREKEMQDKVNAIVSDNKIRDILMDPKMQTILQECNIPGNMGRYMQDNKWGPKIKLLIAKGLIKVE